MVTRRHSALGLLDLRHRKADVPGVVLRGRATGGCARGIGMAALPTVLLAGCVAAGGTEMTDGGGATRAEDITALLTVGGTGYSVAYAADSLWMEQARDAAGRPVTGADGRAEIVRRVIDAPVGGLRIARADGGPLGPGDEATALAVAGAFCSAHPETRRPPRFGRSLVFAGGVWTVLEVCS